MTNTTDNFYHIKHKFLYFLEIKGIVYHNNGGSTEKDYIENIADAKTNIIRFSHHHQNTLGNWYNADFHKPVFTVIWLEISINMRETNQSGVSDVKLRENNIQKHLIHYIKKLKYLAVAFTNSEYDNMGDGTISILHEGEEIMTLLKIITIMIKQV